MALRRGFGHETIKGGSPLTSGPKTFFLPGGTETIVTLLDDLPAEVVVHLQYLKGDKKGNGMRVTCFGLDPAQNKESCPRQCLGCEAMLRHDRIDRKHYLYLTLIDERAFTWEGKNYKDMKRLLELSPDQADLFERRRKAQGSLVGSRWRVYRGKGKTTPRHGNDWNFIGYADDQHPNDPIETRLKRHFWQSPAIPNIRQNAQQRDNKVMSHDEAAQNLITPYDYDELFGSYDVKKMEAFVAYHEAAVGAGKPQLPTGAAGPAMPGGPDYTVPSMPTSAAPVAQPAAPPAPAAPEQPAAPAAPANPPAVPDPVQAGGTSYEAPPFPGAAAPPSQQASATPPQPAQPNGMPGANYQFGPAGSQPQADATASAPPAEPFGTS